MFFVGAMMLVVNVVRIEPQLIWKIWKDLEYWPKHEKLQLATIYEEKGDRHRSLDEVLRRGSDCVMPLADGPTRRPEKAIGSTSANSRPRRGYNVVYPLFWGN